MTTFLSPPARQFKALGHTTQRPEAIKSGVRRWDLVGKAKYATREGLPCGRQAAKGGHVGPGKRVLGFDAIVYFDVVT